MIQGKLLEYGDDLKEVFQIRRKVFVEELGNEEDKVFDQFDKYAIHGMLYDNNIPVATGRMIAEQGSGKLDWIAVLKNYRDRGYGDLVIRMLLNKAFTAGMNRVTVTAPNTVADFFLKEGFTIESNIMKDNKPHCSLIIHAIPPSKCDKL